MIQRQGGCSIYLVSTNSLAISYGYIRCVTEVSYRDRLVVSPIEQSHGYVRVGTMRGGSSIRLRAVVTGLWRVGPHDPLRFTPLHNKDILNYLLHTACCSASLTA